MVEHFQKHHTNEIWNRGWNAAEVLRSFAQEQQQALQIWRVDMQAQVKEFLAEKYPGQNMSRVAEGLMSRFNGAVSQTYAQTYEQNHSRGVRI